MAGAWGQLLVSEFDADKQLHPSQMLSSVYHNVLQTMSVAMRTAIPTNNHVLFASTSLAETFHRDRSRKSGIILSDLAPWAVTGRWGQRHEWNPARTDVSSLSEAASVWFTNSLRIDLPLLGVHGSAGLQCDSVSVCCFPKFYPLALHLSHHNT